MIKKAIVIATLILVIAFALIARAVYQPYDSQESVIEIAQGLPAIGIADLLYQNGIISSKPVFRAYIKILGVEEQLSYGEFHFPEKISLNKVIEMLLSGKVKLHPLTIIEGITISQTAQIVENSGFGEYEIFTSLCEDSLFAYELTGLPVSSLEGFLYPETYMLPAKVTEEYIVRAMVREFFRQLSTLDPDNELLKEREFVADDGITQDFYEILVLASIIEKEATFSDEKPRMAGVYYNRLNTGMRLQADPTVAYALGKEGQRILYVDLQVDSPYNTYRNTGLPPTPICSPTLSSIYAAINPEDTKYFFFFANHNGRHIFSRTYREHRNGLRQLRSIRNDSSIVTSDS